MAFEDRLKEARLQKGYTQEQIAEKIGVAKSTYTGYEKGTREPNVNTIGKLMKEFGVDANFLWQDDTTFPFELTYDEMENLVKKYRKLDPYGQETIDIALDRETTRVTLLKEQADQATASNTRIAELENALHQQAPLLRMYTYMHKIAAAGKGFYFEDIPTDTLEAPYMEGADFIIGVNGDSMEPTYYDGELVYVQKRQIVETGDIGVFTLNNEWFIKEAGEEGLISHNDKYPVIPGTPDIHCIGKVLGKVSEM